MDKLITVDELIERFDLTSTDTEGVELDRFIEEFELSEEKVRKMNVKKILEAYKRQQKRSKPLTIDFWGESTRTDIDYGHIIWFIVFETHGQTTESIVFNLSEKKGYYTNGSGNPSNEFGAGSVFGISQNEESEIISAIKEYKISDWNDLYKGEDNPESTGNYDWGVSFQFEDGTIKNFQGGGLEGNYAPGNFSEFMSTMRKIARKASAKM